MSWHLVHVPDELNMTFEDRVLEMIEPGSTGHTRLFYTNMDGELVGTRHARLDVEVIRIPTPSAEHVLLEHGIYTTSLQTPVEIITKTDLNDEANNQVRIEITIPEDFDPDAVTTAISNYLERHPTTHR